MIKTREQIEKQLDENIPREAVSQRSGGGTKSLSYLETWYVIDRLNKIFGPLGWDCETTEMVLVSYGESLPTYRAKVRITVSALVTNADGSIEGFRNVVREGTGWGSDKSKLNPHEMACKEAESDALKRAAMKLGISMGLGLYDKSGEFIEEAEKTYEKHKPAMEQLAKSESRDSVNKAITANSTVVIAKKLYTGETLRAMLKEKYGVDNKEALTDSQANELLAILKKEAQDGKRQ